MDKIQSKASQLWVVFGFVILIPAHLFLLHSPKPFFSNYLTCDLGISLELSPTIKGSIVYRGDHQNLPLQSLYLLYL